MTISKSTDPETAKFRREVITGLKQLRELLQRIADALEAKNKARP